LPKLDPELDDRRAAREPGRAMSLALTSRSRTWRCGNNSRCFAADGSDSNSGDAIVSSGFGSPTSGLGGARRSTSFARDCDSLAPARLPRFPDLEVTPPAGGSTTGQLRVCGSGAYHGARESALGSPRIHGELLSSASKSRGHRRGAHGTTLSTACAPTSRRMRLSRGPPEHSRVVALPHVGGLHHRYVRRAA
jgi:hypothetical protein